MSEVSGKGPPVYLAHFDEDNYADPHYQSIVPRSEIPQPIHHAGESQSLISTMTSTQNFLPPESSTSRKRPRSPGEDHEPVVVKLTRTDMGWKVNKSGKYLMKQPNNLYP